MSDSTAVGQPQTIVFTDATVRVSPSRTAVSELWADDGILTHVGPQRPPYPDGALVVDASGTTLVPLQVESALRARPPAGRSAYDLVPGNAATLAAVHGQVDESRITRMLVVPPRDLLAVLVGGTVVAWRGSPTRPAGSAGTAPGDPRLGTWVDLGKAMEQHLTADGRYSETRSGRRNAYTGRFWLDEDRITYLDDQGFWAFGEFVDGVLHHAGFVLRR
ncbi:putative ligand-binding protein with streptavidin-like fold [Promicromonospora sp. AC04]|uniref:Atu4866 domain-containing protein n=1 Tax=Promicromonospora sp. AC04 TaxID=2135723 RepID=UPI000D353DAF|nr:Atu4866 domain-containing protein [Promicromonospora sp. AC04]PUB24460.1 putative ligand-binding protein with streptavidin-like fold [Promicromonospora sp. AC04]